MPITITMPALSPTMTEGTLAKWLMKEGDPVQSGDLLAEIETDKATMEVESIDEGVLARILVAEGTEGVPVNAPIAILLEEGEDASALEGVVTTPAPVAAAPVAPAPVAAPAPGAITAPAAPAAPVAPVAAAATADTSKPPLFCCSMLSELSRLEERYTAYRSVTRITSPQMMCSST